MKAIHTQDCLEYALDGHDCICRGRLPGQEAEPMSVFDAAEVVRVQTIPMLRATGGEEHARAVEALLLAVR